MSTAPIVIIGSGMAGYTLATEIRKQDASVLITVITGDGGEHYAKPMLSNALSQGKTPDALARKTAAQVAEDLGVTVLSHTTVTAIDTDTQRVRLEDGRTIAYSRLVLSVGATPRAYPGPVAVPAINTLDDYRVWRSNLQTDDKVLVIGAGLIGAEFANDLATAGYAVSLVDPAPQPLGRLVPESLGQELAMALTGAGVVVKTGRTIAGLSSKVATLDDGTTIAFDQALSAIGLIPNTALADAAGLTVNQGIVVDGMLQTSAPNIFALGDCAETPAGVLPFVIPLMASARALAKTLTGTPTPLHLPAVPVTVKTPALPTVVCPPQPGAKGAWRLEGGGPNRRAIFESPAGDALGFALMGDTVSERQSLQKEMPDLLGPQ